MQTKLVKKKKKQQNICQLYLHPIKIKKQINNYINKYIYKQIIIILYNKYKIIIKIILQSIYTYKLNKNYILKAYNEL